MKALSIRQPYVHLIMEGLKTDEFRSWSTDYRGPLLIHASQRRNDNSGLTRKQCAVIPADLETGGFVGVVDLVGVRYTGDPNPAMAFAWKLRNPRRIRFKRALGKLRLFEAPDSLARRVA